MKTIILDSSVYIASLNSTDVLNKKTKEFIVELKKETDIKILTPALIILEVANILKKSSQDIMAIFIGGEFIEFDLDLVEKLIPVFKVINLKTSDAVIVGCAKLFHAELISWDKKLVREAKKLITVYSPEDYL